MKKAEFDEILKAFGLLKIPLKQHTVAPRGD
jgi:hypothetical protein